MHHVVAGAQDPPGVQGVPIHREGVRLLPGMDGEELGLELVAHGMDAVDFKSCVVDAASQQAHEVRPILREGIEEHLDPLAAHRRKHGGDILHHGLVEYACCRDANVHAVFV